MLLRPATVLAVVLCLAPAVRGDQQPAGQALLDQAIQQKLLADSPTDLQGVIEKAQAALDAGLDERGAEFARKLLAATLVQRAELIYELLQKAAPNDANGFRQLLRLRTMALGDLEQALENDPQQAEACLLVARLHIMPGGDPARAMHALNEAIRAAGEDHTLKAEALALRGEVQVDPDRRLADYEESLRLRPDDVETLLSRAQLYFQTEQHQRALADLDRALELEADLTGAHHARGLVLAALERFEEALQSFNRAIELDDQAATSYLMRARVHAAQENFAAAIADLDTLVEMQPQSVGVRLLRAECLVEAGQLEQAKADIQWCLDREPRLPAVRRAKAMILAGEGRLAEAVLELESLDAAVLQSPELLVQLAGLYRALHQPDKALWRYTAAIEIDANFAPAYRGRGDLYVWLGKHAEAIADYRKSLELLPDDPAVLNNLAWLLCTSPDESLRDGARAVQLATRAAEQTEYKKAYILSTLAAACAEQGDFEAALRWIDEAVQVSEPDLRESLGKEKASYQQQRPWRERHTPPDDAAVNQAQNPADQPRR